MTSRNYVSTALPTVLAANLGASGNPSVVSLPGTWPASYPFCVLLDWGTSAQEAILVTSAPTGTGPYTLPCTRGIDNTTQQAHNAGAQVEHGTTGYEPALLQTLSVAVAALVSGGAGGVSLAGDLGGTTAAPTVVATHLTDPLPPAQGGAGVFSPMTYGAVGNGTANDDTPVHTACSDAAATGGIVDLGYATFLTSTPIPLVTGLRIRGAEQGGGGSLVNNTSDLFSVTGTVDSFTIENCSLTASAGHVFNCASGSTTGFGKIRAATITQSSASHAIWYMPSGTYLNMLTDGECTLICSSSATQVPWYVVGLANSNTWQSIRVTAGTGVTVPFFQVECDSSSAFSSGNTFRDVVAEVCVSGIISALTVSSLTIENVLGYDTTTYSASLFSAGAGTGGLRSQGITVRNSGRIGGTLGSGAYDFQAASGTQAILLENVGPESGSPSYSTPAAYTTVTGGVSSSSFVQSGSLIAASGRPWYDIVAFGADPAGTSDSAPALSAAQTAAGSIFLPPGTFLANSIVTLTASAMRISGAGMFATTLRGSSGLSAILKQAASPAFVSEIEISDLTIDCNSPASSHAIANDDGGIGRLILRRVRFINTGVSDAISASYAANFVIEDCVFEGGGQCTANFFAGAVDFESLTARRNKIRYFANGFTIGTTSGAGCAYVEIADNDLDGGWWTSKAVASNSGSAVSYTATTIADSSAPFTSYSADQPVRVMPALQSGTVGAGSIGTLLSDTSATYTTNGVRRGHIVRTGSSFGIVSAVISQTALHVEEWLSQTTYLPVTPPSSGSYTVYGIYLGNIQPGSSTSSTLTIQHGASGGGGGWYDLTGSDASYGGTTPAAQTLYEILPRPVYPVYLTGVSEKVQVVNNRLRRGWADQVEAFGIRAIITGNIIEDGNNYGIAVAPRGASTVTKTVVASNLIKHNAFGLLAEGCSDTEIGPNQYEDNGWGVSNAFKPWQLSLYNAVRCTVTGGNATNSGECVTDSCGLSVQGASTSACKVQGFTGNGHTLADIYIESTVPAGAVELISTSGVLAYQGTTNGQLLQTSGSGSPILSVIASPGSTYLSTGGGSGTTLYVKETGTDDTGWTAFLTSPGYPPVGNQAAYAKITSSVTQVLAASAWTAVSGAPSITLPNDGNTYEVTFTVSSITSTTAENIYVGIGTSTTAMLATTGANLSVGNPYNGRIQCQSVTGSGQTITVYGWATTGTPTLSLVAGGATGGPCELAAYRVV